MRQDNTVMEADRLDKEFLLKFEEEIRDIYLAGAIRGPIHLSGNNEDQLIEIFKEVRPEDWVLSTHRSHYHALLKGVPPELVKAEILAGRSIHLNFQEHRFLTSAIVGGIIPIALGLALAIKLKGENRKVWAFVGDMAAETGIFHECTKYAARHNLPLIFVIEDNGLSTNTPTQVVWGQEDGQPHILKYSYTRIFPHIGVGQFVVFS